jgi:hypothetical protein
MVLGRSGGGLLLAAGLTVAVYGSVRSYGYVAEDVPVTAPITVEDVFQKPLPRQLTDWTLRAQVAGGPRAMHLGNLAVHLVNGLLIAALIWPAGSTLAVCLAAGWWLAPIQTESVVYLSGRADLLVVCFTLLALLANRVSLVLALVCCLGAVWAKETGVMSLALLALWRASQGQTWRGLTVPSLGLAVIVGLRLLPRLYTWTDPSVESPLWYAAIQLTAVWRLLALVVWPVGLTVDHDWDAISHLVALLVVINTMALTMAVWHVKPARFALCWIGLALLPRFLVPHADWLAERHLPFALLGPWLALKGL